MMRMLAFQARLVSDFLSTQPPWKLNSQEWHLRWNKYWPEKSEGANRLKEIYDVTARLNGELLVAEVDEQKIYSSARRWVDIVQNSTTRVFFERCDIKQNAPQVPQE